MHVPSDRSAGSPTETLLRLLLPLNKRTQMIQLVNGVSNFMTHQVLPDNHDSSLPSYSIGSSDGRCVQRAGTYSTSADDGGLLGVPRSRVRISKLYPNHE